MGQRNLPGFHLQWGPRTEHYGSCANDALYHVDTVAVWSTCMVLHKVDSGTGLEPVLVISYSRWSEAGNSSCRAGFPSASGYEADASCCAFGKVVSDSRQRAGQCSHHGIVVDSPFSHLPHNPQRLCHRPCFGSPLEDRESEKRQCVGMSPELDAAWKEPASQQGSRPWLTVVDKHPSEQNLRCGDVLLRSVLSEANQDESEGVEAKSKVRSGRRK